MNTCSPNVTLAYIILQALAFATELGHTIDFQWVPGHCGIQEKLDTDYLALMGHESGVVALIPFSTSDVCHILHDTCRTTWSNLWFDARAEELVLYSIDPNLNSRRTSSLPCAHNILLDRRSLEITHTQHFLYRIHGVSSPACECGHRDEDVEHLLYCTALVLQHNEMNYAEDIKLSTDDFLP